MMRYLFLFVCTLVSLYLQADAQNQQANISLGLPQILQMARQNSPVILAYQHQIEQAEARYVQAKNWFLPNLYAGTQMHHLRGTAMNSDGHFFTQVNRRNFWGGIGMSLDWDLAKGIFDSKEKRWELEGQKEQVKALINQELLKIVSVYLDLQAAEASHHALALLVEQSKQVLSQIEQQVQAGAEYKSALLLAQSNHRHLLLRSKRMEWKILQQQMQLAKLLGMEQSESGQLLPEKLTTVQLALLPRDTKELYIARGEFQFHQKRMEALQTAQQRLTRGLLLPRLQFQAEDAAFGDVFSPLYQTYQFNVSLIWEIPISRLFGRPELQLAKANTQLEQAQLLQTKLSLQKEIREALAMIDNARTQLALSEEGVNLAREALEQSIARQKLRTARPFEVFQAQEYYLRAELEHIDALVFFNLAQYKTYVSVGNDL